jgi:DNA-binding MarR family transcriptional regulator
MSRKSDALQLADPAHPDFLLADSPLYWLARASGRYRLDMELALKPIGMDVPRWRVLAILSEHEPASVSELCEHAVIRLSTMTRIVQRLVEAGLVTTRPREDDGRVTEVRLTDAGREAAVLVRKQASRVFRQGFEGFSAKEVKVLNEMLKRLFDNFGAMPR